MQARHPEGIRHLLIWAAPHSPAGPACVREPCCQAEAQCQRANTCAGRARHHTLRARWVHASSRPPAPPQPRARPVCAAAAPRPLPLQARHRSTPRQRCRGGVTRSRERVTMAHRFALLAWITPPKCTRSTNAHRHTCTLSQTCTHTCTHTYACACKNTHIYTYTHTHHPPAWGQQWGACHGLRVHSSRHAGVHPAHA